MTKDKLKRNFEKACTDYIEYFCKKQDIEFEFWIADEIGGIAAFCCAEHFFNLTDIILDINSDQPKNFILDWQNESTDYSLRHDDNLYINYSSYIKGARFKPSENESKNWFNGGSNYK